MKSLDKKVTLELTQSELLFIMSALIGASQRRGILPELRESCRNLFSKLSMYLE